MASGTIQPNQQFVFEEIAVASSESLAGTTGQDFTTSVTKTGYTPVGIVGVYKSGASYASVPISRFYIEDGIAHVAAYNTSNVTRTVSIVVTVMYRKN